MRARIGDLHHQWIARLADYETRDLRKGARTSRSVANARTNAGDISARGRRANAIGLEGHRVSEVIDQVLAAIACDAEELNVLATVSIFPCEPNRENTSLRHVKLECRVRSATTAVEFT